MIEASGVPVHSFYLLNEKTKPENREKTKQYLESEFKKLSVNKGQCAFLDIHDEVKGQDQLKEFFKYLIVYRATEINLGAEAALKSVQNFKVSFTWTVKWVFIVFFPHGFFLTDIIFYSKTFCKIY